MLVDGIKRIEIFESKDEYFYVKFNRGGSYPYWYRCDQLEGLMMLLDHLFVEKPDMRLKLFEDFKRDDYYQEIPYIPEYKINKMEYDRVFSYLYNTCDRTMWVVEKISYNSQIFIWKSNSSSSSYLGLTAVEIWIVPTEDEYYYVRYDDGSKRPYGYFYKCDQFEGLELLLKDKSVI